MGRTEFSEPGPSDARETLTASAYLERMLCVAESQLTTHDHGFPDAPLLAADRPPPECAVVRPEDFDPAFVRRAATTQTDLRSIFLSGERK